MLSDLILNRSQRSPPNVLLPAYPNYPFSDNAAISCEHTQVEWARKTGTIQKSQSLEIQKPRETETKGENTHPTRVKSRNQHLDLSSQTQMPSPD